MAKPRHPQMKAEASGAVLKNAGRFKGRKVPKGTRPVGEPYKTMTEPQVEAWEEFRSELPWLNSSHRALLQIACVLRANLNTDPDMGINKIAAYSSVLSKLAATPVDETKVARPDEEDEDPADQYFN